MQKIVFVSHCLLNTASKVVLYNKEEMEAEEALRRRFLQKALDNGIQLIQLPCPEFTLYGSRRWGHVSDQFANPFFRQHCRKILKPILDQLEEYLANDERFAILGIVGIDGSPSCGVDYTCYGDWYGSFEGRSDLDETLQTAELGRGEGIFMQELKKMLKERGMNNVRVSSLFASEPDKCLDLLDD